MALPTNRNTFKELILRRLGKGAIKVEITDDQLEDQIDFALAKFADYHFDGTQESYYAYQVTQTDIDNKWIPMEESTLGVTDIFDISSTLMGAGMWNVQYQYVLNNMSSWGMIDLTNYWMTMSHLQFMQQVLVGKQPFRYNRYVNKLQIDMDWHKLNVGDYIVARVYDVLDPSVYPKVWADQWLIKYTTALAKLQWGNNLKKYEGMQLPSGMSFNGQKIWDEANAEIEKLEETLINTYSMPASDLIG